MGVKVEDPAPAFVNLCFLSYVKHFLCGGCDCSVVVLLLFMIHSPQWLLGGTARSVIRVGSSRPFPPVFAMFVTVVVIIIVIIVLFRDIVFV